MTLSDFKIYNTVPKLFWRVVAEYGDNTAIWNKKNGIWDSLTWREYGRRVTHFANALIAFGLNPGDKVGILSQTRTEWIIVDMAIMSVGCITVPIYHSNTPSQIEYIIKHSGSRMVIVEDQEQLDKINLIRAKLPDVTGIVVINKIRSYSPQDVYAFDEMYTSGEIYKKTHPHELEMRYNAIQPGDGISFIYTSGTTGHPKAVIIDSVNVIAIIKHLPRLLGITEKDLTIAYLPLAHIAERVVGNFLKLTGRVQTAFAESIDELAFNLKQTGPTVMFGTPRIFEKFYARITTGIDNATAFQKRIYNWTLKIGQTLSQHVLEGRKSSNLLWLKNMIAHFLIFRKIREIFGGKIRFMISGGAPISPDIIRYFHWVGIEIYEVYGMTETTGLISMNYPGKMKIGSVGHILPSTEVKIAEDGEICARGPQMCAGYYMNDAANTELWQPDQEGVSWLHTGDIGYLDKDGFLYITDRKKDIIITAGGKNVAPQNIENLLKMSPYISQAMVYGDRRPYLSALITLDEDEITKFARDQKILYRDLVDITTKAEVIDLIKSIVKEKNKQLASYETVKRFHLLEREFDQDKDEITPTLKIKRKVVTERYKSILDNMYNSS